MTEQTPPSVNDSSATNESSTIDNKNDKKRIVKIIIRSWGGGDCLLRDCSSFKITIRKDRISYSYALPCIEDFSDERAKGRWQYNTTSPIFQRLFKKAAKSTLEIIRFKKTCLVLDGGSWMFKIVYNDNTSEAKEIYGPWDEEIANLLSIIKQMVPPCESNPYAPWFDYDKDYREWTKKYGRSWRELFKPSHPGQDNK